MKDLLKKFFVSDRGIAAIETDLMTMGASNEANLKVKINAYGSAAVLKSTWEIAQKAADALAKEYLDAPQAPAFTSKFATFFAPLTTAAKIDTNAVVKAFEGYGTEEEIIELVTDVMPDERILGLFNETDDGKKARLELGIMKLRKALDGTKPVVTSTSTSPVSSQTTSVFDPNKELGENEKPSMNHVNGFASSLGIDPMMLMMFMNGGGVDMDLSSLLPVQTVVAGYNPKVRTMFYTIMGHIEKRLGGVPIVVIDSDGSINRTLTAEYIQNLEDGFDPAPDNVYDDSEGNPREVIHVGVDAQSVYDADPLDSTRALQKNGMGIGRIKWTGVSMEARQVVYFAVRETREIDPKNDAHLSWLRDHVKPTSNRLSFHGQAPRAITLYNERARSGSLPNLRVMLSRGPRRPETMPRRRTTTPRDLTGMDGESSGFGNVTRRDFPS